jgi:2-C-methyl-D-erythritol 4-phosphate cytidylyltransferase/2-C-methyl-D-erythritol 2,4-cyclodiphosphate synthase
VGAALINPEIKKMKKIAAVVAAGGTGTRMHSSVPKQFLMLGGRPILAHSVRNIAALPGVSQIVCVLPQEQIPTAQQIIAREDLSVPVEFAGGGPVRQESVRLGVVRADEDAGLILVHDAVRPLCDPATMLRVANAARECGAAVPGLPATETIQRVSARGRVLATPPREELYTIQTPQCFHAEILRSALERARTEGFLGTDESSVVRWAGHPVRVVAGSPINIKVNRPLDLAVAEWHLSEGRAKEAGPRGTVSMIRIGQGIDYHRLVEGRRLILGGVEIPFEKGLEGHSDADALIHAVCDALLGAAALGDIGQHFPDSDPANRGRASFEFLTGIREKLAAAGWVIHNIDATILAQRPKLAPFMPQMRCNIAGALGIQSDCVSVKATTTEGLNAEGRGEGISAHSIAIISPRQQTSLTG